MQPRLVERSLHLEGEQVGGAAAGADVADPGAPLPGVVEGRQVRVLDVVVEGAGGVEGAVLLEQASDPILTVTNRALVRLMSLTLLVTLVVGMGLLGYATWLSLRVRRLAGAAQTALGPRGEIRSGMPGAAAGVVAGTALLVWFYLPSYLQHPSFPEKDLFDQLTSIAPANWSSMADAMRQMTSYESLRPFGIVGVASCEHSALVRPSAGRVPLVAQALGPCSMVVVSASTTAEVTQRTIAHVAGATEGAALFVADTRPQAAIHFSADGLPPPLAPGGRSAVLRI